MLEIAGRDPAQGRARAGGDGAGGPAADAARSSPSSRAACRGKGRRWCSRSRGSSSAWPSAGRRSSTSSSWSARDQAADQVSIGNSIGSLRFLGATDWRDFVEALSVRRAASCAPTPAGVYASMDFATRDRYRHVVEAIAKRSPISEEEVARAAVELAGAALAKHEGRARARRLLPDRRGSAAASRARVRLRRRSVAAARCTFGVGMRCRSTPARSRSSRRCLTAILSLEARTSAASSAGRSRGSRSSVPSRRASSRVAPRALGGDAAGAPAHPAAARLLGGHSGGAPDGRRGADPAHRCRRGRRLLEALEVRFLANRDANLAFALLSDFRDAPSETLEADAGAARGGPRTASRR